MRDEMSDLLRETPGAVAARAAVLLPFPLPAPFDYRLPPGVIVRPGDVVRVPLHGKTVHGVVWDTPPDPNLPARRLRPLMPCPDLPHLPEALRRFVDWVAAYTLSPVGEVLAMAIRAPLLVAPAASAAVTTGW